MNRKLKYMVIAIFTVFALGFFQSASAGDLIVVASKATQKASRDWFGFLESKEIPVKTVTPESFSNYKDQLYIVVLGDIKESKDMEKIAKEALTSKEFEALSKSSDGQMYYKPQAWNVGQKVILFLGTSQKAVEDARKSTREEWFDMLKDWFDIEDAGSFHVY